MCGICGFFGTFEPALLNSMSDVIAHRGPDDSGAVLLSLRQGAESLRPVEFGDIEELRTKSCELSAYTIGLAHRRLSIIDLSPAGHQPMCNEDGTVWITYNGEIYNYKALGLKLKALGHNFKSSSDTEVILHAYEEWGVDFLDRLNGIFAFAIYDGRGETGEGRRLFLARDGLGVKPLYYAETASGFVFSSEIKALIQCSEVSRELNPVAIHYHLAYLWSPAPETMLKGVKKLPPGHAMIVQNGRVARECSFYDLPYRGECFVKPEKEIVAELQECLEQAVKRQMVSDVPVGAFLSGGLDSSSVVAFAKQMNPDQKLDCFTIDFENSTGKFEGFSEDLPYAQKVAKYLGVNLHTITVGAEMVNRIEEMIYFLDEPQADPAPLNALFISELAREHGIKVLLSGAGGDDIFSGYRRHYALLLEKYWSWLPMAGRKALRAFSDRLPQNNSIGRRLGKAFRYADCSNEERLISYFLWIDENIQRSLYADDLRNALADTDAVDPLRQTLGRIPEEKNPLNRMLYLEAKHFLADHNLNYTDKMGMAAGVEVRVPLLDKELIDFATRIPPHLKQKGRIGKYIFKKAMEPHLPKNVIYRPKSGFGAPLRQWLHNDLREVVLEMLGERSLKDRGLFDAKAVGRLVDDDYEGRIDGGYTIFSLMCIEWWMRMFLDGNQPQIHADGRR